MYRDPESGLPTPKRVGESVTRRKRGIYMGEVKKEGAVDQFKNREKYHRSFQDNMGIKKTSEEKETPKTKFEIKG